MGYYYYKDGEKIGPVDPGEFYNLLEWGGDIKPDTIIEWPNGKQLPASENSSPPGSNPLNISLKTARRLAVAYNYIKLSCLLGMLLSFSGMVASSLDNSKLANSFLAALLALTGAIVLVEVLGRMCKLNKVPPKPIDD